MNWFDWLNGPIAIKDDTEVITGTLVYVRYQPLGGLFDLCIGSTTVRYNGTQTIQYGTIADASQALFGQALNPQN